MNASRESDAAKDILYINFNQTATALSVGTKSGYTLYDLETVYECKPTFESRELDDICIIERSFSSSLVAYVKLDKPRNLVLYNYRKGTIITEKLFPNTVLSVKLNRQNVVVCLEDRIYILNVRAMSDENTHIITNTPTNVKGLIALTYGLQEDPSLLAYPGSSANGDVQIFDAVQRHAKITIRAHDSQLAALAFDEQGERLATASIKGTVIRVFSVASGDVLFEFRRGVKRCVEIHTLSFYKDPELLCASSNTETIHLFKLCHAEPVEPTDEESEGWMEMFGRVLTQSAKYLPAQMSDVLTQQRSFAYVHLPFVDQKTVCAISFIKTAPFVVVASLEGFLYIYNINTELGGACHLVKQHRLEGPRTCFVPVPTSLDCFKSKTVLSEAKQTQSSPDCDSDPTACLKPQVVSVQHGISAVDFACFENELPELCSSNGIHDNSDGLPPILTAVEP